MSIRPLTALEQAVADAVVQLGSARNWEFAGFLKSPSGPVIEFITRMKDDRADPSSDVVAAQKAGAAILVHHNHLTQESLSSADWNGLVHIFDESFAHCADGTAYWGRALDRPGVIGVLAKYQTHQMNAANFLFAALQNGPQAADLGSFFSKEVVNQAMRVRKFVDYEVEWGSGSAIPYSRAGASPPIPPAGIIGSAIAPRIAAAAQQLAPSM